MMVQVGNPPGYGGEETSAYSSDNLVSNPTKFGAKVRAIFLKDTSGKVHPYGIGACKQLNYK